MEKWLLALADRLDWPVLTLEIRRCGRSDRGLYFSPLVAVMAVGFVGPDAYCLPGSCILAGLILAALDIALIGGAAHRLESLRNSS